jgi:hypothetical protein
VRRAAYAARFAGDGGQVREIGSGAEAAARAGDNQHPHLVVGAGLGDLVDEGAQHGVGHGVALVGAIDGQCGDPIGIDLVADVMGGHGFLSSAAWKWAGMPPKALRRQ